MPASILFVCMGNICRSPAAEGAFLREIHRRGLEDRIGTSLIVDSAGTIGAHAGAPADQRMRSAAQTRGIALASRARKVVAADRSRFDWVVAMDQDNLQDLESMGDWSGHLVKLGAFLDGVPRDDALTVQDSHRIPDVPDPYYGGTAGFEHVLDLCEQATPHLLDAVLA